MGIPLGCMQFPFTVSPKRTHITLSDLSQYPQCLGQCLTHRTGSIENCWKNKQFVAFITDIINRPIYVCDLKDWESSLRVPIQNFLPNLPSSATTSETPINFFFFFFFCWSACVRSWIQLRGCSGEQNRCGSCPQGASCAVREKQQTKIRELVIPIWDKCKERNNKGGNFCR